MSDLSVWLKQLGLSKYQAVLAENEIELADLTELSEDDLREIGLPLGPRRRILKAARQLGTAEPVAATLGVEPKPESERALTTPIDAERRHLTVMFVDLVGSTALSGRLDPEDMREVITAFQNTVERVVTRYEGNVAKYMGDGVLCYFGWPQAHEDDAERAVRAGLGAIEAIAGLTVAGSESLEARGGIATGLVVVGDLVGKGAAQEEAVIGQTPNLAARLQGIAEAGELVIAAPTRRLLGSLFEVEDMGEQTLKGIGGTVRAYAVRGERNFEGRFDAQRADGATGMVGREQELALLLERWQRAVDGEGQMVLLTGEAGIGKSRVVRALLDALADTDHTRVRCQCSPYHTDTALFPTTQQLSLAAGFRADDPPEMRLDKLERLLSQAGGGVAQASPLIARLLGLGEAAEKRHGPLHHSPQQRRLRTLEALVDQLHGLSAQHPVLFTLEDAHWIDATTLEFIQLCLDRINDMRVLMLVTARPTFHYDFGGHPNVTQLALNKLGRIQVREIVLRVTKGKTLPAELFEEIEAKTDGVPLFVEELTKTVLESSGLRETDDAWVLDGPANAIAIPTSLHDSLMARLDRLQPIKEVAQTAACIGREFDHELISKISPLPIAALNDALERLIDAELLFRRGTPPDATYWFKHALVRDAAYESLLKSNRKLVHGRIVNVLEETEHGGDAAEPAVLAQHCQQAELMDKAIEYWRRAGQQAIERSANLEAIAHLNRSIKLVRSFPTTLELQKRELRLQTMLSGPLIATKGYGAPETGAVFARAQELSEQVNDPTLLFPVLYQQWVYNIIGARIRRAEEHAQSFVRLADSQDRTGLRIVGHRMNAGCLFYRGELAAARSELETALALYNEEEHSDLRYHYGQDSRVACLAFLSIIEQLTGNPKRSLARSAEAIEQATKAQHVHTLAYALCVGSAQPAVIRRDVATTGEFSQRLLTLAEQQGLAMWAGYAKVLKGWTLAQMDRGKEAVELAESGLVEISATRTELEGALRRCCLAEALASNAQYEDAIRVLDGAVDFVQQRDERYFEAEVYRLKGRLLLAKRNRGALDQAEALYKRSIEVARRQGAISLELRTATDLARLWAARGERGAAVDMLEPLLADFAEGAETPDLADAKNLLGELR